MRESLSTQVIIFGSIPFYTRLTLKAVWKVLAKYIQNRSILKYPTGKKNVKSSLERYPNGIKKGKLYQFNIGYSFIPG